MPYGRLPCSNTNETDLSLEDARPIGVLYGIASGVQLHRARDSVVFFDRTLQKKSNQNQGSLMTPT